MTSALAHIPDWMYKFFFLPWDFVFPFREWRISTVLWEVHGQEPSELPTNPWWQHLIMVGPWWNHANSLGSLALVTSVAMQSHRPCSAHSWLLSSSFSPSFPHSSYLIASFSGNRNVYKSAFFFFFPFFDWLLSKTLSLTRLKNTVNKKQKELAFTRATNYYVLPGSEGLLRTQDFYIINDDRQWETLDVRAILSEISLMQLSPH